IMAKKNKESNILDVVKGIQQAAANAYDGSGKEVGLKREKNLEGEKANNLVDSRVMDGFGVTVSGDVLKVSYHGEVKVENVHDKKFEREIEQMLEDIVSFLKKEYKSITGSSLSLKRTKDPIKMIVQTTSRVRAWVQAQVCYVVGNIDISDKDADMDRVEKGFKAWLKQSEAEGKKPKNVKISKEDNQPKDT
ncbi:MAG: hypothetical protein H7831_13720, partial [Magnetococcus sp. WYHC-3]